MQNLRLEYLPILSIDSNPDRIRQSFKEDSLDELQQAIRATGLNTPITVREEVNGRYTIIFGERRWRACSAENIEKIPCLVVTGRTLDDQIRAMIIDNLPSINCSNTPQELAVALKEYVRVYHDNNVEEAAASFGRSRTWLVERLAILEVDVEIKEAARTAKMSDYRTLVEIDRLNKADPQKAQILLSKMSQGERVSRQDVVSLRGPKRKTSVPTSASPGASELPAPIQATSEVDTDTVSHKPSSTIVTLRPSVSEIAADIPQKIEKATTKEKLAKIRRVLNLPDVTDEAAVEAALDKLLEIIGRQENAA